jgi:hypothetical protein
VKIEQAPQYFLAAREQFFEPLCRELSLGDVQNVIYSQFGYASAVAGSVRVFFEYERGLTSFSLGPQGKPEPMWDVEIIAARFPRVRILAEGVQRLSLEEQSALIARHWDELQEMFDANHIAETRRWLAEASAAHMATFTKAGG